MKVLLISASTDTLNMPTLPLGLACVAAATQAAGHEVALLNLMFELDTTSAVRSSVLEFRPDIIGISVRNIDDQNMDHSQFLLDPVRQVVADCRNLCSARIAVGGAGYSIFPESALRYLGADIGIQGEGEVVFPDLVHHICQSRALPEIPGVYLPGRPPRCRSFAPVLDDLPLPDPALWIPPGAENRGFWIPVQTRRGCPMDCSFCSTGVIEGRSIRRRSPGRIVAWLAKLRETGCRRYCFVDNTFNLPPSYAKELCRRIIQADLDCELWYIVYPKWIDAELAELMRRAGCTQVSLGFESGSDRMLRRLNKRFNGADVRKAANMLEDAGTGQD